MSLADDLDATAKRWQQYYKYMDKDKEDYFKTSKFKRGSNSISFFKTSETVLAAVAVAIIVPIATLGFIGLFGFLLM